jgi:hypothetical protein
MAERAVMCTNVYRPHRTYTLKVKGRVPRICLQELEVLIGK